MYSTKYYRPGVDESYIDGPTFTTPAALQEWLDSIQHIDYVVNIIWQLYDAEGVLIAAWPNGQWMEALS